MHLGPIEHWWVATPKQRWESTATIPWQVFSGRASQAMWDERNALLGEDQLVALDHAQHMRFIGQVHEWLGERNPQFFTAMSGQQISEWLSSNLQSGRAWGLITEQAQVLWAEACVDLGQDFTSQSVYQNWLSNESNGRLPPEIRIKAFDEYRHSQKDVAHDL